MAGYLYRQVEEGSDQYQCVRVTDRQIEKLFAPDRSDDERVNEARMVAILGLRNCLHHGGLVSLVTELAHRHPWLWEDAELGRYLRECSR